MGGLFSSPKMPTPAPAPVAPTDKSAEVSAAQQDELMRRQAAGRSSTILNGGAGLGNLGTVSSTSGMLGGS
jgi:hypothetical protein